MERVQYRAFILACPFFIIGQLITSTKMAPTTFSLLSGRVFKLSYTRPVRFSPNLQPIHGHHSRIHIHL